MLTAYLGHDSYAWLLLFRNFRLVFFLVEIANLQSRGRDRIGGR